MPTNTIYPNAAGWSAGTYPLKPGSIMNASTYVSEEAYNKSLKTLIDTDQARSFGRHYKLKPQISR
jgi:hypothetical protein